MDLRKNTKSINNNKNDYPSTSKRLKISTKNLNIIEEVDDKKILEEMGIGILETDESSTASSSSSSAPSIIPSSSSSSNIENDILLPDIICHGNDENINTSINLPENLDICHQQEQIQQLHRNNPQQRQYLHQIYLEQLKQNYLKDSSSQLGGDNNNITSNDVSNINSNETKGSLIPPPPPLPPFSSSSSSSVSSTITTKSATVSTNATPIPATNNYKVTNTNIEIYVDNNNSNKMTERIHKRIGNNNNNNSNSNISSTTSSVNSKGRSPLSIVSYNNNLSNTNYQNTTLTTTSTTDLNKKQQQQQQQQQPQYVLANEAFIYRNRPQKDPFKKLSDEMILQIFKWLPKKTLVRCSYVCRRFNQLAQDESLWTRLDLAGKILKSGALGKILLRGVVILRLAQTELCHPVFEPDSIESSPEYETKLQYLDLSMAVISKPSLKMLLSKCRKLKKLSLEHVKLNDEICIEISKNINLEALNLTMCDGIESWSIKNMMSELKQLHSLNISWTSLNVESVKALVDHITPDLLRLNIAGCRKAMFDSHLATLSKRCPGLLELDLSDCTALTSAAIDLICNFKDLEYLSLSRCYGITASSYMKLSNLTSLSYLDVFGLLSDAALTVLQNSFPTVGINKFIYSSVARPTVGTRRTSIWGLRTRD